MHRPCGVNIMAMTKLAPSILTADFGHLAAEIAAAERGGADYLHLDIMDGSFVPNISYGAQIVQTIRNLTELPLDVHLMIVEPDRHVPDFAAAGADIITIHAEASVHLHRSLSMIREHGVQAGLAVNPLTPLDVYLTALPMLDLALIMSVNPGFGGQQFIDFSTGRLEVLRGWRDELSPDCIIQVDGGINTVTAPLAASSGADLLVVGSAVFNDRGSVGDNLHALRQSLVVTPDSGL